MSRHFYIKRYLVDSGETPIPGLDDKWFSMAERAALKGETIVDTMHFNALGITYYMTANQVTRPGCCAFTYWKLDGDGKVFKPTLD